MIVNSVDINWNDKWPMKCEIKTTAAHGRKFRPPVSIPCEVLLVIWEGIAWTKNQKRCTVSARQDFC